MLLVRRKAPDGGYFNDGDRAAGVFGVLATGFAVLLGFIVFLAFASYDASRAGRGGGGAARSRNRSRPRSSSRRGRRRAHGRAGLLRALCLARRVGPDGGRNARRTRSTRGASSDLPHAQDRPSPRRAERGGRLRQVARPDVGPRAGAGTTASTARSASSRRRSGWCCSSAPRSSSATCCSSPTAASAPWSRPCSWVSVIAVIAALLLLLQFLDNPFHEGVGGLRPVAMERALLILDQELRRDGRRRGASLRRDWAAALAR